jgi:hypothetical protein
MLVDRYWDLDGRLHIHDPNGYGREFYCALGHAFGFFGVRALAHPVTMAASLRMSGLPVMDHVDHYRRKKHVRFCVRITCHDGAQTSAWRLQSLRCLRYSLAG